MALGTDENRQDGFIRDLDGRLVVVGPDGVPIGGGGGGGGTEYTEGDVDASITGTAIMWEADGDALVPVSLGTPLPVSIGDSVFVRPDSGEVFETMAQWMNFSGADALTAAAPNGTGISVAGLGGLAVQFSGTYAAFTVVFQQSLDSGVTWQNATATKGDATQGTIEVAARALAANATEHWAITLLPGATDFRIISFGAGPATGTCNVLYVASAFKAPNAQVVRVDSRAHDDVNDTTTVQMGGHASATAPSAVASGDRVRPWHRLSGEQVIVGGAIDHDGVNDAQVVQVGGHATSIGSSPTAVASGDRARFWTDTRGALHVRHGLTTIADGRTIVTTAGTRVVLAGSTVCDWVEIQALHANTGVVVIGGATCVAAVATRRGYALSPGQSKFIEIDNLTDISVDAMINGEGVSYIYGT